MISLASEVWRMFLNIRSYDTPRMIWAYFLFIIAIILFIASSVFCVLAGIGIVMILWEHYEDIVIYAGTFALAVGVLYLINKLWSWLKS